jgi:hypothetical protein
MTHDDPTAGGRVPGRPTVSPAAAMPDPARLTYRYLRVSVVVMGLLLFVGIGLDVASGGERFGSISGYYYSPVRSLFVGTLVAIGPALIAIKGRPGWEDMLLDLAGMVIPVVALVPVPRELGEAVCGAGVFRCVPPDLVPAVVNNVTALAIMGVPVLVFAWWTGRRAPAGSALAGLLTATGAYLVLVVWFWVWRDAFLVAAHNVAAVGFFLLTAAVAWINSRRARARVQARVLSPTRYAQAYRVIATVMVGTVLVALAGWVLDSAGVLALPFGWVFVVESILLGAFIAFWILQTAENWDQEAASL